MRRKIDALDGGVMVSGAKVPQHWYAGLEGEAIDKRVTRATLVRNIIAAWLEKHTQYNDIHHAAECNNRSYGQQLRQILEDEVPHLCPPINEWRSNGASWSKAIREGRTKRKMAPTVTLQLPGYVETYIRKLAKDKPDVYATPEDVLVRLATRWVEAQIAKKEGADGQVPR